MPTPRHDPTARKAAANPDIDLNPRRDAPLDFPDRALGELTPADYDELGFLCGLEVHQQLATAGKLFCRCPAGVRTTHVDAEVLRQMRPTLSEMGEYDGTALMEFKTRKEIVYLLERSSACTYELDDTPPFPIDREAVRVAMQISRLFDLDLVSELHVMRKQYLDGSIPTGFQRTAMVGLGGAIPFRESELGADRVLRIRQLTLEEDSCREVSDVGHRITFRTDRLGMPLIETVTEPDLLTPRDVAAGGRLVADVARASGLVRRGAGAARQDVNVSIAGSRRVEIKGVDRHRLLPLLVHNEAYRHLNLLRVRAELQRRGVRRELLDAPDLILEARATMRHTRLAPVRAAVDRAETVYAVRIPGFAGLLEHPTQPGQTFFDELSERVRVIACPTARPFMVGSDRTDDATWKELRRATRGDEGDALVVLWGPERDVQTGAREVLLRAQEAFDGVPSETRQARRDGTTGFERILPGPQRMYPDTDTPPLPIRDEWVAEIESARIERPWEREERYVAAGLTAAAARRLARAPWADVFDAVAPAQPVSSRRLAAAFEKRLVHHWRKTAQRTLPGAERLRSLVAALEAQRLPAAAFEACFDRLLSELHREAEDIVAEHCPRDDGGDLLAALSEKVRQARPSLDGKPDPAVLRWAMGQVLRRRRRGEIDPMAAREHLVGTLALQEDDA